MDLREELYNHMIECMPDRIKLNDEQKMYILEYMERYTNAKTKHNESKHMPPVPPLEKRTGTI